MALRARLIVSLPVEPVELPELEPKWASLPARLLWKGERRMEAETYLSSGYGLSLAFEERASGWCRLGQLAEIWQPSRLKGITVSPEFGTPFFAATQVFDLRPVPRKWLSLARTENASSRFVTPGTILVTCSGAVGRSTLAHAPHSEVLISHDLLRVEARDPEQWGWIYAYLRSPQARAMMSGAQYGHIIKHLETSHLEALPIPLVRAQVAAEYRLRTQAILDLRNRAHQLVLEAERQFETSVSPLSVQDWGEEGFTVSSSQLLKGRRRLEANFHNPGVALVLQHLSKHGRGFTKIGDADFDIWLPGRFKRIPAADGVELVDSSAVFEINPDYDKRIADGDFGDPFRGRVMSGWLLMARSGQIYGLNGNVAFATKAHEGRAVSDDLLRIAPRASAKIRTGYLFVALSHPLLGRPLVKALAYGSSIPHIEASDLLALEIVRLSAHAEECIACLAEESAAKQAEADIRERELAEHASRHIDEFLAGKMDAFAVTVRRA